MTTPQTKHLQDNLRRYYKELVPGPVHGFPPSEQEAEFVPDDTPIEREEEKEARA
jgi:hypothetical protein